MVNLANKELWRELESWDSLQAREGVLKKIRRRIFFNANTECTQHFHYYVSKANVCKIFAWFFSLWLIANRRLIDFLFFSCVII